MVVEYEAVFIPVEYKSTVSAGFGKEHYDKTSSIHIGGGLQVY